MNQLQLLGTNITNTNSCSSSESSSSLYPPSDPSTTSNPLTTFNSISAQPQDGYWSYLMLQSSDSGSESEKIREGSHFMYNAPPQQMAWGAPASPAMGQGPGMSMGKGKGPAGGGAMGSGMGG